MLSASNFASNSGVPGPSLGIRLRTDKLPGPYLRDPRCGFFNCDCRTFFFFRLGLLKTKVPLPRYSAL
jgi:hypothetical protein